MGKQHELLAVEASLKGAAAKIVKETVHCFTKRQGMFEGQTRRYTPVDDEGEKLDDEDKELVSTVPQRLEYTWDALGAAIDAVFQKELTNTIAKADVKVDGEDFLAGMPATALLTLEKEIGEIRSIVEKIPTLEAGKGWTEEETRDNVWKSKPVRTRKTEKQQRFETVADATKEHKAQVVQVTEDALIGHWETIELSGCISSDEKHKMLTRIDTLLREVKQARARANSVDVVNKKISKKIFEYIMG